MLVKRFPCSLLFKIVGCIAFALLLSSCSTNSLIIRESLPAGVDTTSTNYSIVFVIHGDGNYLYHDTNGNEYTADEEVLKEAKRVAEQNSYAEVFIFHQKPMEHFLFFFHERDGEFYYYRNGHLVANELYWRDEDSEVGLYNRFYQRREMSVFLYFGHKIPEFDGLGYDESYPDKKFTVHEFANGLKEFTRDSTRFDLMILSTCYGGTPYTIGALGPYARTIIASPGNLHLSYFDLNILERLDLNLKDGDVPAFAKLFARQSFDILTRDILTSVSIAVYDVDRIQKFLYSIQSIYTNKLISLKGKSKTFLASIEHCDCADLPEYVLPTMNYGVDIFYRPARFGRLKEKENHSGWECWRNKIIR